MSTLALRTRILILAVCLSVIILPAITWLLDQSHFQSLITATKQKGEAYIYSLIAEAEPSDEELYVGDMLPPALQQEDSGVFAVIADNEKILWRSTSSISYPNIQLESFPKSSIKDGELHAFDWFINGNKVLAQQISVSFEIQENVVPLTIYLLHDIVSIQAQQQSFRNTLLSGTAVTALTFIISLSLGFWWFFKPIKQLDQAIVKVETGESNRVSGNYPQELTNLVTDLNLLLSNQERQKLRYTKSLSDLTHALKTPLAILHTSPLAKEPETLSQLNQINNTIEHQLKRVSIGSEQIWKKQTLIKPLLSQLVNAMEKIYRDKELMITLMCDDMTYFNGEEADFMEIIGNLLDNACKASNSAIQLTAHVDSDKLTMNIEDDGCGIDDEQKNTLFLRGARLDNYQQGHGVGMAIVNDLVNDYFGTIIVKDSDLGGAHFIVSLPTKVAI